MYEKIPPLVILYCIYLHILLLYELLVAYLSPSQVFIHEFSHFHNQAKSLKDSGYLRVFLVLLLPHYFYVQWDRMYRGVSYL